MTAGALGRAARRTTVLRVVLGVALVGTLAWALAAAVAEDVRHAPVLPSGTRGVVVLDLSASVDPDSVAKTLMRIEEERAGLVVFSDFAYELLPPGTPGRELAQLLRFFTPQADGALPANPWLRDFNAGTRISEGLRVARETLLREGGGGGSIVLLSDLDVPNTDVAQLTYMVDQLSREGIVLRVVPMSDDPQRLARFERLTGRPAVVEGASGEGPVRTPEEEGIRWAVPWTFALVGALLLALLAVNERACARLEVMRQ